MKKLYKNWAVHNLLGHPFMYLTGLLGLEKLSVAIHDNTLPEKEVK